MTDTNLSFTPTPRDASGVVSWIHVGDLHMLGDDGQNSADLNAIIDEVNRDFANGLSFVFLPGDNADDRSVRSHQTVRKTLNRLNVPWCAIVGDHDVHEKSYDNSRRFMGPELRYAFSVGRVRFVAMNAFDEPRPDSFVVSDEQASWLDAELAGTKKTKVVLLHCYPSELKANGPRVGDLIRRHDVRVVDMGHTHYNEVSNDGRVIYTATRSTGQIDKGPVGYSVSNLDGGSFSWRFYPLGEPVKAMIVRPCDARLTRDSGPIPNGETEVRVRVGGASPVRGVRSRSGGESIELTLLPGSHVWVGMVRFENKGDLIVEAEDEEGNIATDTISTARPNVERHSRDLDNTLDVREERGLLGTRLGPNANGREW